MISIIDVIIRLGRRNIAFRGNWVKEDGKEDGNFQYLIHWKANFDESLKLHLSTAQHKCMSPKVQNEFIHLCELENRDAIRDRCSKSEYFSIMADETTDVSEVSEVYICVWYVYVEKEQCGVYEDFLGFEDVDQTNAETISQALLQILVQIWGLISPSCEDRVTMDVHNVRRNIWRTEKNSG